MIEKLKLYSLAPSGFKHDEYKVQEKINELIDIVNALVEENNIHEEQIDELQMKLEPEKCETPAERMIGSIFFDKIEGKMNPEPADKFAEQRKWIGKLCRFWDFVEDRCYFDTLKGITDKCLFIGHYGFWEHCEPVSEDMIYKGE